MSQKTIAQLRAGHALVVVCGNKENPGFKEKSAASQKKINSYIAGFGPMILMNGFGQACAFYLSSKEKEHQEVYKAVAEWLARPGRPHEGQQDLIQAIVDNDAATYRLAQAETLAYLDWLKKLAKAFLKGEDKKDEEGKGNADTTQ